MKSNFLRLLFCYGLLGLSPVLAQDTNEPKPSAEAPEAAATSGVRSEPGATNQPDYFNRSLVFGLGNDVKLNTNETSPFVIAIGANAKIDGIVDGPIVVVGGNLDFNGEAHQETWVIGGSAHVKSRARVNEAFTVIGGDLTRAEGATFTSPPQVIGPNLGACIQSMLTWCTHGLLLGRPVVPSLSIVWIVIGAFFALYCLVALLFRNAAATTVQTIELHPIGSLLTGFLVLMLSTVIISTLIVSIAGVFLLPFVLCGLFFAALIGKVAVYEFMGCLFSNKLRPPGYGSLLALTVGMAICVVLGMIPFVGFMVWGMIGILGVGAVTVACFRLLHREAAATQAAFVAAPPVNPSFTGVPSTGAPTTPPASPPVINRTPLAFPLAGFWPRAGAFILDLIVVGGALALVGGLPLFPLGILAYSIGFLVWRGSTIGCMIAGIRCIRTNGGPVTWSYAIVRTLASILSFLPLGMGFLWGAIDANKQTWHDKVAGTVVVKLPPTF